MQMRKVVLTVEEQKKYDKVKSVVDHGGNKNRLVIELGLTARTINRLIVGYKEFGKAFFSHKNKGRKPVTTLTDKLKRDILDLYNSKYYDASYEFFTELLSANERIYVSVSTVRNILMGEYILSPKANRKTIRNAKKELEAIMAEPISKKKKASIQAKLIDIEDAHPRKPRRANFGEELQMDASEHEWFGGFVTHLHAAIDDATGRITGAHFDEQETLSGYYNVFAQTLRAYGIPYKFRTDRRTVFEYKLTNSTDTDKDTYTQFAYACTQLGVDISSTSIPQGKGRIERLFGTLQGRLPILFRLAGITTIEAANEFMISYLNEFNAKFALDHNAIPSVFETQPTEEKINLTLAVLSERKVDSGHSVKYDSKYFRTIDNNGRPVFIEKGTTGLVIKAFDGRLFFSAADMVVALEHIQDKEAYSKELSALYPPEEKKPPYIPPLTHPWKKDTFDKFQKKMRHRKDMTPAA
jgi:hypothetical protein